MKCCLVIRYVHKFFIVSSITLLILVSFRAGEGERNGKLDGGRGSRREVEALRDGGVGWS